AAGRQPDPRAPPSLADGGRHLAGDRHRAVHRSDRHAAPHLLAEFHRPWAAGRGDRRRGLPGLIGYFGGAGYWMRGRRFSTTAWASKARGSPAGLAPLWVTISAVASNF